MSTTSYKPQPRELLPEWMIGMTDRIMDFYTKRYLHCDPVILKNPPPPQDGHKYLLYAHIPFCHTLHLPPLPLQGACGARVLRESSQGNGLRQGPRL